MKTKVERISLQEVLENELKDPEFDVLFDQERIVSDYARLVRDSRQRVGMTQMELANKVKTTQSVIARLESGNDRRKPSLGLLGRIAKALGFQLIMTFSPPKTRVVSMKSSDATQTNSFVGDDNIAPEYSVKLEAYDTADVIPN